MSLVVPAVLPQTEREFDHALNLFATLESVSRVQIDVVDGRFASPASWPFTAPKDLVDRVSRLQMLPHLNRIEYEIDMMCLDADKAAEAWLEIGAARLTFHAEAISSLPQFLVGARNRYGHIVAFGLAINVTTHLSLIEPVLDQIEYVQFMGIAHIGRQGEPFDERVIDSLRTFHTRHPSIPFQVDGGVSPLTAKKLVEHGVSNLIIGSGILRVGSPAEAVDTYNALASGYRA